MGIVLAVNVEAMEGRTMSNNCALSQSQKRCFMLFYRFYLYILAVVVLNCLLVILTGIPETQKGKFSFYAFIMNNKFLFLCVFVLHCKTDGSRSGENKF